jgi:hypothetical protein
MWDTSRRSVGPQLTTDDGQQIMIESIDDVPLIIRREIEARILAPFVDALSQRMPREDITAVLGETIQKLARDQGAQSAFACGGNDLAAFTQVTDKWQQCGALELTVIQHDARRYDFNVTRCQFAEMYHRLGIPELGDILSCSRDFAASEGFNPDLKLTRTQTIMSGAPHCNFRYALAGPRTG